MPAPADRVPHVRAAPVRVVIAEDNYLLREGIRELLSITDEVQLVGIAADLPELEEAIAATEPEVVVTDIRMPPTGTDEGVRAASRLRAERPAVGVVLLSQHAEPEYVAALLAQGAAGRAYLLKERVSDIEQLVTAIREVAGGGSVIDPRVVDVLVAARSTARHTQLIGLTPRELEVLGQVAQGKNNAGIAKQLFLTERGVEKHINAIFSKLNLSEEPDVHRRVKAALMYLINDSG